MSDIPEGLTRTMITLCVIAGAAMVILDSTIAVIALPSMAAALGATHDTVAWVLTSFVVALAVATPLTGVACDRFGRKRVALTAITLFALASALCGAANNLGEMVAFRIAQGAAGAMLVPIAQSTLLDINPPERHGQAMGLFGSSVVIAPIFGPTIGGWLTETMNWRWVFYVNVPIAIAVIAGLLAFMPSAVNRPRKFDLFGFAFLATFIAATQLLLDRGEGEGWLDSIEIAIYLGAAVCALWVFVIHSATARTPFIDLTLFQNRNYVLALGFIFVVGGLLLGGAIVTAPMLQTVQGYPAVTAGIIMAPRGIGSMLAMLIAGRLADRIDPRYLVYLAAFLLIASLFLMTGFDTDMGPQLVIWTGVMQGFGFGFGFVPLSTLAFATLPPHLRTDGASFYSLMRNFGGSVGVSIIATQISRNVQAHHARFAEEISPFNPAYTDWIGPLAAGGAHNERALSLIDLEITRQALMMSYLDSFALMMVATVLALPLILLLRPTKRKAER